MSDLQGFVADKQYPATMGICEGFHFYFNNGRWRIELGSCNNPLPDWLAPIVEEISLFECLALETKREAGVYRHESAEAEVGSYRDGRREITRIRIQAKNMDDTRALLHKIKAGTIRPDESYEGQQTGMSRQELEAKVAEYQELLHRANEVHSKILRLHEDLAEEGIRDLPKLMKKISVKPFAANAKFIGQQAFVIVSLSA